MAMDASLHHGEPLMIDFTPTSAVAAGDIVVDNGIPLIAHEAIAANTLGAMAYPNGTAVYKVAKVTGVSFTRGAAVYWDEDGSPLNGTALAGAATSTTSANTYLGTAEVSAASGDTHVYVVVDSDVVTLQGSGQSAITDPGNAGAIPVTSSGSVAIVTAGSETRTLAIPTFVGQELTLYIKTDGGTCVITVASAINQTGNNTITMAEVRDVIKLQGIESGSNKVWFVVANDGAALSTV